MSDAESTVEAMYSAMIGDMILGILADKGLIAPADITRMVGLMVASLDQNVASAAALDGPVRRLLRLKLEFLRETWSAKNV